jgi:hypothetical protein
MTTTTESNRQQHRCRDHLAYIGGSYPYECLICGKRLSALDIYEDDQP